MGKTTIVEPEEQQSPPNPVEEQIQQLDRIILNTPTYFTTASSSTGAVLTSSGGNLVWVDNSSIPTAAVSWSPTIINPVEPLDLVEEEKYNIFDGFTLTPNE